MVFGAHRTQYVQYPRQSFVGPSCTTICRKQSATPAYGSFPVNGSCFMFIRRDFTRSNGNDVNAHAKPEIPLATALPMNPVWPYSLEKISFVWSYVAIMPTLIAVPRATSGTLPRQSVVTPSDFAILAIASNTFAYPRRSPIFASESACIRTSATSSGHPIAAATAPVAIAEIDFTNNGSVALSPLATRLAIKWSESARCIPRRAVPYTICRAMAADNPE
ncbi:hypothetical protein FI667_g16886, partial [Globisporangium splendens]